VRRHQVGGQETLCYGPRAIPRTGKSITPPTQSIESALDAWGRQSVPGLPDGSITQLANRSVESFAVRDRGADVDRTIALVQEVIDKLLVLIRCESVASIANRSVTLLPD